MGQTDYYQIIGLAGPAYYPAGHLWHYALIYKMFEWTNFGYTILKLLTYTLHSLQVCMVGEMAYNYFQEEPFIA